MNGNMTTQEGNLTKDPELNFTPSGKAVVNCSLARNWETKTGDKRTDFFDFSVWGDQAENVAASLSKGDRVVVHGSLRQSSWEDKETGATRSKIEIVADSVSACLRFHRAAVTKAVREMAAVPAELVTEEPY